MKLHRPCYRRRAQQGAVGRGVLVVLGMSAALGLQVAGPQLQGRLASLVGCKGLAPAPATNAATPSPRHSMKVAEIVALATPSGAHPAP